MHCGEYTYVDYYRCSECKSVFKAIEDRIEEDSIMKAPDDFMESLDDVISLAFSDVKSGPMTEEEFREFVSNIGDDVEVTELRSKESSMTSLIHRCLKCQSLAFETREGLYRCSECGFEWEVVDFG
jgi:hypothetical protein